MAAPAEASFEEGFAAAEWPRARRRRRGQRRRPAEQRDPLVIHTGDVVQRFAHQPTKAEVVVAGRIKRTVKRSAQSGAATGSTVAGSVCMVPPCSTGRLLLSPPAKPLWRLTPLDYDGVLVALST